MDRCQFCQGELDPATRRCLQCGQAQPEESPAPPTAAAPQPQLTRRAMLAGLAIGGVGMIGLGALALRRLLDIPHILLTYRGHSAPIQSIAWSPDGTRIASSASDGTVRLWNASTGSTLLTYRAHAPYPHMKAAAWSPDGRYIASSCLGSQPQIWDASSGQQIATLGSQDVDYTPLAWSPDGTRLAMIGHLAQVWDIASARLLLTHQSQPVQQGAIAWSPDGTRIATVVEPDNQQPSVEVWDATSGRTLLTYRGHHKGGFLQVVGALSWSPNGTRLVSGGSDGTAQVWNATTGKRLVTYRAHDDSSSAMVKVAWSPDGRQIVSTGSPDHAAQVWDATTGELLLTTASPFFETFWTNEVAWSPDGTRIAASSELDNTVRIWQIS